MAPFCPGYRRQCTSPIPVFSPLNPCIFPYKSLYFSLQIPVFFPTNPCIFPKPRHPWEGAASRSFAPRVPLAQGRGRVEFMMPRAPIVRISKSNMCWAWKKLVLFLQLKHHRNIRRTRCSRLRGSRNSALQTLINWVLLGWGLDFRGFKAAVGSRLGLGFGSGHPAKKWKS